MKAHLRNARISPKKMNLIAGMVRRQPVTQALDFLKVLNKKGAEMLYKLVASAAANAEHNFSQNSKELMIDEVKVTKGSTLKRIMPVSRGRAHRIEKVNCHVSVILKTDEGSTK